jgi:hypothetical protein
MLAHLRRSKSAEKTHERDAFRGFVRAVGYQ